MANPFYGAANYGVGRPFVPPIGTQGVNMNPGFIPNMASNTVPNVIPQQPIMQPVVQNNVQQNLQSMIPQSNMIWIDDMNQIAGFPTGRGWQQWFGLKNDQVMYVRETDMNGVTQPIRRVRYTLEMDEAVQNNETTAATVTTAPVQTPALSDNAVSREEFNALSASVKKLTEKLSDLLE